MHIPEKNITSNQQQLHDKKWATLDLEQQQKRWYRLQKMKILTWILLFRVANGCIIIPKNNIWKQNKIKVVEKGRIEPPINQTSCSNQKYILIVQNMFLLFETDYYKGVKQLSIQWYIKRYICRNQLSLKPDALYSASKFRWNKLR